MASDSHHVLRWSSAAGLPVRSGRPEMQRVRTLPLLEGVLIWHSVFIYILLGLFIVHVLIIFNCYENLII